MAIDFGGGTAKQSIRTTYVGIDPSTNSFTAAMWIYADALNSTATETNAFLSQEAGAGTASVWLSMLSSGTLLSNIGGATLTGGTVISTGTWNHVALTCNVGSTVTELWLNGSTENSTGYAEQASTGNINVGSHHTPTEAVRDWNGKISDVRIFNRVLDVGEISQLAAGYRGPMGNEVLWLDMESAQHTNPHSGLVSHWEMNSTSFTDSHGSNDLTNNTNVGTTNGVPASSNVSTAGNFPGTSNVTLSVADNASLSFADEDFTLAVWSYIDADYANRQGIAGKLHSAGQTTASEYLLTYRSTGTATYYWDVFDGITAGRVKSSVITTGQWSYVVGRHDSVNDLVSISVGTQTPVSTAWATGCQDKTNDFTIGKFIDSTGGLRGKVDEVSVWNRFLTNNEISMLYDGGQGKVFSDWTAAEWEGMELSGSQTLIDLSGNGNDGTPYGYPTGRASTAVRMG